MIIDSIDKTTVERTGDMPEVAFGIADVAKAFHALTTQIYKNPSYSVIAEICANAADSQLKAHEQDPTRDPNRAFDVHLPNVFEPFFSVRDYGVSMSHEFMMSATEGYCAAFYSTKSRSNLENGAFGIGRLTLLALRDTYSAICYMDGRKRTYSIFKENGKPKIVFISDEETTEENGFEVHVEVSNVNFDLFAQNAVNIFRFYPTLPNVVGHNNLRLVKNEYSLMAEDKAWGICSNQTLSGSFVVMGVYSYPIDPNHLPNLDETERELLASNLHIFLPLGSVSISLSRDGLFYDKDTCAAIKTALANLINHYKVQIQAAFDLCPTLFEAKKLYAKFYSEDGTAREINKIVGKRFYPDYKGEKIDDYMVEISKDDNETRIMQWSRHWMRGKYTFHPAPVASFPLRGNTHIFLDKKEGKGVKRRIRYLYETLNNSNPNVVYYTINFSKRILEKYGIDESVFPVINDVVVPKGFSSTPRKYNEKSKFEYLEYNFTCHKGSDAWDITEIDADDLDGEDIGCYVLMERYRPDCNIRGHQELLNSLGIVDLKTIPIIGVRYNAPEELEKFKKAGWKHLTAYAQEKLDEAKKAVAKDIQRYQELYSDVTNSTNKNMFAILKNFEDSGCNFISEYINEYRALYEEFERLRKNPCVSHFSRITYLSPSGKALGSKDTIHNKYPVLKHFSSYGALSQDIVSDLKEYVALKNKHEQVEEVLT